MTTIKCHCAMQAFNLRQAMWAMGYAPRFSSPDSKTLLVPDMDKTQLNRELAQYGLTLVWSDDANAELVQIEERRHAS